MNNQDTPHVGAAPADVENSTADLAAERELALKLLVSDWRNGER